MNQRSLLALLLCWPIFVLAHPSSPLAVAVAVRQFQNAKLVPDVLPTFNPNGLMNFNYTSNDLKSQVGDAYNQTDVVPPPQHVYIHGTASSEAITGGPYNVTTHKYTVVLFDANYPGSSNPNGYTLNWLSYDWTYGDNNDHTVILNPPENFTVPYSPPNPASGTGPHRYVGLVYAQPDGFTPPTTPSNTSFDINAFALSANFSDPICGTYFTVEVDQTTVSVASTTAVVSTTLAEFIPSTSSASKTSSSTAGATQSSSSSPKWMVPGLSLVLVLFTIAMLS